MEHSYLTFIFSSGRNDRDTIESLLNKMGNPASAPIREAFRHSLIVHFISAALIRSDEPQESDYVVLEASVDGPAARALALFDDTASGLREVFEPLFQSLGRKDGASNAEFLRKHRIGTGQSYFQIAGLNFSGTPGMSVTRIRDEYRFARRIRDHLETKRPSGSALNIVDMLRHDVRQDPDFNAWKDEHHDFTGMLTPEPTSILDGSKREISDLGLLASVVWATLLKFMWPVLIVSTPIALWAASKNISFPAGLIDFLWHFALYTAVLVLAVFIWAVMTLRSRERKEEPDRSLPDPDTLAAARALEDRGYVQNHLFGVSRLKPGYFRKVTLRLAFWIIGQFASKSFRPGYLADIGTIHFARWFVIPRTDKLIFCSNYGGSWESYLEDFINKATYGLTSAWTNTVGFPWTRFLFLDGASQGEEFKRWARRQQIPTRFWYCAYPHLTTARIRTNAAIRQGLSAAQTENEAEAFLSLFASSKRTPSEVDREDVQSILFGGLGRHTQSACLLIQLPDDPERAAQWLNACAANISFGSAPNADQVHQIAFTHSGLSRLNLPAETRAQFSYPFRQGMTHPERQRALSDTGDDHPDGWRWGHGGSSVDCAYLLYVAPNPLLSGEDQADDLKQNIDKAVSGLAESINRWGGKLVDVVITDPVPKRNAPTSGNSHLPREPFGFVDGVSQPIIKGLSRGTPTSNESLHHVAPGEFILGYPDNRGTYTLLPTLPAEKDPDRILPAHNPNLGTGDWPTFSPHDSSPDKAAPRAFAQNGSYLVIRQLSQNTKAFSDYLDTAVAQAKGHKGIPSWFNDDQIRRFLAAKMVGRWQDGTSLVKFPYEPGTGWDGKMPNREPDNDFRLGKEDPSGSLCPYGSHIRRANPRDSFPQRDDTQLEIVNRHRILRRGRFYGAGSSTETGLFFMCLNADIERQFEFIQQTWCMAPQFMGLDNEVDPIIGRGRTMGRLTIPTPAGPIFLKGTPDAVTVVGGGYFFLPSRSALQYLGSASSGRTSTDHDGAKAKNS